MRAAVVLLVLLVLAASAIWLLGRGDEPGLGPMGVPPNGEPVVKAPVPSEPPPPAGPQVAAGTAPAAVATRMQAALGADPELADRPTACLRVVDIASKKPLAGASVRRLQSGAMLGFTDDHGLVDLPLKQRDQLAVVADGYLIRLATADVDTTHDAPQEVRLVRDRWSERIQFEFTSDRRRVTSTVFARLRPLDAEAKAARGGPGAADPVTKRAWSEHTMLAAHFSCADTLVQLGSYSADRVLRLDPRSIVSFAAAGRYEIEAVTTDGLAVRRDIEIQKGLGVDDFETIHIALERGDEVWGKVLGATGPLADASVTLQGGEPLGLVATTDKDGLFRLGPLAPGQLTLLVSHGDHEPAAYGPVVVGTRTAQITLKPLPKSTLRGRVRARPDLKPIADATVAWQRQGEKPIAARTEADGTFRLPATGGDAARLLVSAPGYIALEELVAPGSPFAEYDLLPGSPEVRVEKGMSALLTGVVVDAQGRPVAGAQVRWTPDQAAGAAGMPTRRVLSGGTLELPGSAVTGEDGAFKLETNAFGPGLLGIARAPAEQGLRVEAVAGTRKDALRLQR